MSRGQLVEEAMVGRGRLTFSVEQRELFYNYLILQFNKYFNKLFNRSNYTWSWSWFACCSC